MLFRFERNLESWEWALGKFVSVLGNRIVIIYLLRL